MLVPRLRRRRPTATLAGALAFTLLACGDDPTGPKAADIVTVPTELRLRQTESQVLTVTVTDASGTLISGVPVTFASENESLITVSNVGVVTSTGPAGSAAVRVSAAGLTKSVPVIVEGVATTLQIAPAAVTMPQKGTATLEVRVIDRVGTEMSGQELAFRSLNEALVTVAPTGAITSVGPHGTAGVEVRGGTLLDTVDVTVTQVPSEVQVAPGALELFVRQSTRLSIRTIDAIGVEMPAAAPYAFGSSNSSIATVEVDGTVRGVAGGDATITVQSGSLTRQVAVKVIPFTHPQGQVSGNVSIPGAFGAAFTRLGQAYAVSYGDGVYRLDLDAPSATKVVTGTAGLDLAINADGTRAYVANQNMYRVDLVDLTTGTIVKQSPTLVDAALTDLLTDEQTLWVGTGRGVVVLNASSLTPVQSMGDGATVHLARHPTLPYVYASANLGGTVSEIDIGTRTVRRTFTLTGVNQGVAVSRDGKELYVANESGPIHVVDLASGTRVGGIDLGESGGYGLALSPDGLRLYVSMTQRGKLVVVDPATRSMVQTIAMTRPRRLAFNTQGTVLLVANEGSGVTIIR